jgi:hypothetical protein
MAREKKVGAGTNSRKRIEEHGGKNEDDRPRFTDGRPIFHMTLEKKVLKNL